MENTQFLIEIHSSFKKHIERRRQDFIALLYKVLTDRDDEVQEELLRRFGTKIVTKYDVSATVSVIKDGDLVYKK